jgi:hypothetical protein
VDRRYPVWVLDIPQFGRAAALQPLIEEHRAHRPIGQRVPASVKQGLPSIHR